MHHRADVAYLYDGSWEGFLCCIFASYERREVPADILLWDAPQLSLLPTRQVESCPERAERVRRSLQQRISPDFCGFVARAFLTCLPGRELMLLELIRAAYREGPGILDRLTDERVDRLTRAVRAAEREAHLLKGFLRFSLMGNILAAQIGPRNPVLPLLAAHFAQRYPREAFLIHDTTHGMALVYRPYEWAIVPMERFELAEPDSEEARCRALWRQFYDAIAIEGRLNPRCRMSHMPKRYWQFMTEMAREEGPEKRGLHISPGRVK